MVLPGRYSTLYLQEMEFPKSVNSMFYALSLMRRSRGDRLWAILWEGLENCYIWCKNGVRSTLRSSIYAGKLAVQVDCCQYEKQERADWWISFPIIRNYQGLKELNVTVINALIGYGVLWGMMCSGWMEGKEAYYSKMLLQRIMVYMKQGVHRIYLMDFLFICELKKKRSCVKIYFGILYINISGYIFCPLICLSWCLIG